MLNIRKQREYLDKLGFIEFVDDYGRGSIYQKDPICVKIYDDELLLSCEFVGVSMTGTDLLELLVEMEKHVNNKVNRVMVVKNSVTATLEELRELQ